jgi:hypothetical protein
MQAMIHIMKSLRWIAVAIIIFILVLPCQGGWVISEKIIDNFGNSTFQTTFIQENRIRFENASSISIIDLNQQLITIIFPNIRAYWQGSTADLAVDMIKAYDSQVQTLVLGLPFDQQEEFQQMYDSIKMKILHPDTAQIQQDIDLIITDSLQVIKGFLSRNYLISKDSSIREKIWITSEVKPYAELDTRLFVDISNKINPYSRKGFTLNTDEYLELLSNGLIVKSVKVGERGDYLETMVTEVKEINIPPDFFLPPINYRSVSLSDAFILPMTDPLDGEN